VGFVEHEDAARSTMIVSGLIALGLLIGGIFLFRHMEKTVADLVLDKSYEQRCDPCTRSWETISSWG
jgi:hypothetical protein